MPKFRQQTKHMSALKSKWKKIRYQYAMAKKLFGNVIFYDTYLLSKKESKKQPSRTTIINYFLTLCDGENYLEIGVRNPADNFDKILCKNKYSVDPGIEFKANPVDFKLTSDAFFNALTENKLSIPSHIKFDVIFIDGLHTANQVLMDIKNSLQYIKDNGFIILHDCNPPTIFHARENYKFTITPARGFWNGTTWKAFYKYRQDPSYFSICFDTDWGVGVLSKTKVTGFNTLKDTNNNHFFEYEILNTNRVAHLNLKNFDDWKSSLK